MRPAAPLAAGGRRISRFPCEVLPCVLGVSDRAGSSRISRKRCDRCCLPPVSTTSAPRSCPLISRLDTRPAHSPVNASPPTSRSTAHDSGPAWVASPSPYETSIRYTSPVLTGARTPRWTPETRGVRCVWSPLLWEPTSYSFARRHLAPRPTPSETIAPSSRMARSTFRINSRLVPGQSTSISEIWNGATRRSTASRTRWVLDPLGQ